MSSTLAEIESLHAITECAYRDWLYPAHRHCLSLLPWGLSTRAIGFLGTGGPPLTQKSLTRLTLPRFLAYVRASGGFAR